jgi:L-alanine-DL-glutamate epimerase-like enolase superfamily enzyme
MRITRCDLQLLHLPLPGPRRESSGRLAILIVQLDVDVGLRGVGLAYTTQGTGRALHAAAADDLAPLLLGEDALDHERLASKVYWRLQTIGRVGLVAQAYAAFDVALWDLKAKAAGVPLAQLLGGARKSTKAFLGDCGWPWLDAAEVAEAAQPLLDDGTMGVLVKTQGEPEADADRLTRIREALGDDAWLGVDAGQRYDFGTALAMGRFFEEEIGADWFEEPLNCDDVAGYARLATRLELPLAVGGVLFNRDEFAGFLEKEAVGILRPDVCRLGGLTPTLKLLAAAERHHRPVAPHLLPEIAVHLACGLPGVTAVEYVPWLNSLWQTPLQLVDGILTPPPRPGLGLEINPDSAAKYRADV